MQCEDATPEDSPLLLLDGSIGHELKARGLSDSFQEAVSANYRQPDLVTSIHAEYVRCGCNILTTNTFVLTPSELWVSVLPQQSCPRCSLLHVIAHGLRRRVRRLQVLIAGCLPPLHHCYLPELVGTEGDMRTVYEDIAKELAPRVDMFLAETLCSSVEANAVLQAVAPLGKPCWVSFTLHDDVSGPPRLRDGTIIGRCSSSAARPASASRTLVQLLLASGGGSRFAFNPNWYAATWRVCKWLSHHYESVAIRDGQLLRAVTLACTVLLARRVLPIMTYGRIS